MNLYELFIGQIPEAVFFPLFVIFCKGIKEKRLAFISLSIFQYLILVYTFPNNSWFQFIYVGVLYLDCKFLWKDKSNILDLMYIFLGTIYLTVTSLIAYFIFFENIILSVLLSRTLMFLPFLFSKNIKKLYIKYWNRNDFEKKKIKSITFRSLNVMSINVMFVIIHIILLIIPFIEY